MRLRKNNKRKSNKNREPHSVLWIQIAVVALIFLATGFYVYRVSNNPKQASYNPKSSPDVSPSPSVYPYPIDTENDGVYTNYEHGVRFTYPKDHFSDFVRSDANYVSFSNKPLTSESMFSEGWFNLSFNANSYKNEFIKKIFDWKVGEATEDQSFKKLSDIDNSGVKGVVYYTKTPIDRATEHSIAYHAVWIRGEHTYELKLGTAVENKITLEEKKPIFDEIVNSLEFVDVDSLQN